MRVSLSTGLWPTNSIGVVVDRLATFIPSRNYSAVAKVAKVVVVWPHRDCAETMVALWVSCDCSLLTRERNRVTRIVEGCHCSLMLFFVE